MHTPLHLTDFEIDMHTPLHLTDFEPSCRYDRRHCLENIKLSTPVAIMMRHYGGITGNINILWKCTMISLYQLMIKQL